MPSTPAYLVAQLAERTGLEPDRIELVLSALSEVVSRSLSDSGSVDLAGVGQFSVRHEPPRRVTDGDTGAVLLYPPRNVVQLRTMLPLPQQTGEMRGDR